MIAIVEKRLPAAGLQFGEGDGAAERFEDLGNGNPDVRIILIRQAGDEECDVVAHGRPSLRRAPPPHKPTHRCPLTGNGGWLRLFTK